MSTSPDAAPESGARTPNRWLILAGGILAKLLPAIDPTPLVDAFLAKREHAALAQTMPLHVVTAEDLGLRGALVCAAR